MLTPEEQLLDDLSDLVIRNQEPNVVDVVAASCGWKPLECGETMTVHYGGKEYKITRTK